MDSATISPGISLSYAFNNYFSVNAGYRYGYDLDTEDDGHGFSVGAECAVTDSVGMGASVHFNEEEGFTGVSAGISFHF